MRNEIIQAIKKLENEYGVRTKIEIPIEHQPSPFSTEIIDTIERTARHIGVKSRKMNSGAGHDAQNMVGKVKTGMIFVPSLNGISHAPGEWTN